MSIESKIHLVPVLKGAVDPRAGIILRTYYIRPEQLRKQIEQARQVPSKPYIVKIPFYNELSAAISTNNIMPLYTAFNNKKIQDKNRNAWPNIVKRNESVDSILTNKHYKQLLAQNIYAFLLTDDKLQLKTIAHLASKATTKKKLLVNSTEKPVKPKLKKSKRSKIKEQFELKTTDNIFDLNELHEPDYGINVKYTQKLYTVNDGENTAIYLSNLINFLNMNPNKVKKLVAKLIATTSLTDKYNIVKNLKLKSSIYEQESPFWIPLLQKLIPETENLDSAIFQSIILWKLDKKSANVLIKSNLYPDEALAIIKNPVEVSLKNDNLRKIALATLLPDEANAFIKTNEKLLTREDVAIISQNLNRQDSYNLTKKFFDLSAKSIIDNALNNDINSIGYYLLQLLATQTYKLEYIPYVELLNFNELNSIPALAVKIYPLFWKEKNKEIKEYVNKNSDKIDEFVNVGITLPNFVPIDYQYFSRINPMQLFETFDSDKHNIKLKLNKKGILFKKDNKILTVNAIDYLDKPNKFDVSEVFGI